MRKHNFVVHLVVLSVVFVLGFSLFSGAYAITSNTTPKPKLETNLAEPGREAFTCTITDAGGTSGTTCDIPTGDRLVIHDIDWQALDTGNVPVVIGITTRLNGTADSPVIHRFVSTGIDTLNNQAYGTVQGPLYSDGSVSALVVGIGEIYTAHITGDLLDCNRLLTTTITVDCNALGEVAHP